MWAFLFGGRLSRIPYALMALPLLAAFANGNHVSNAFSMLFFRMMVLPSHQLLTSLLTATMIVVSLVLTIISGKRLRDISWTGWRGLPYLAPGIIYADLARSVFTASKRILDYPFVEYITTGVVFYGLGLAFILLIVPGRRPSSTGTSPGAVF
jgi:uncharacterized membrane protein YhaH (DUF805 family)